MRKQVFICDQCGENDIAIAFNVNIIHSEPETGKRVLIGPFVDPPVIEEGIKHACSVLCLLKIVSRETETWS